MFQAQIFSRKSQLLLKDERSKRVFKNVLNSFVVKLFSTAVALALIPASIKYINKEAYGLWLTISSVITWINVFDFGLSNGLTNKLTETFAKKNCTLGRIYLSTTYGILLCITITLILLFFLINPFINWNVVFNTHIDSATLSAVMQFTFISFCLLFLFKPINSLLMSMQLHFLSNSIQLIGNTLALSTIYFFGSYTHSSFLFLALVLGFSYPLTLLITSIVLFTAKYKHLRPTWHKIDLSHKRTLFGLSIKFFICQISVIAILTSNNFLISHFVDNESVTYFNVAYRYFSIITIFQTLILTPLWTAFTDAYTLQDFKWISSTMFKINKLNVLLCFFLMIMVLISSKIYELWLGSEIAIPAELNVLFGIYMAVTLFKETYNAFINGSGKLNLQVIYSVITILLQIPLAYLLIRVWNFRLDGILFLNIFWMIAALLLYYYQYRVILSKSSLSKIWN